MSVSDKWHEKIKQKKRVTVVKVYFWGGKEEVRWTKSLLQKRLEESSHPCKHMVKSVPDRTSKWKAHDDLHIIFEEMQGSHQELFTSLSIVFQKSWPHYAAAAAKSLQSCPVSVQPHRRQPTRLPSPWDSPGKNTGVGCHFLLQCMKVKSESEVAQSCLTLSDPMDCSLAGSSVHGIFQARGLEGGAIAFSNCWAYTLRTPELRHVHPNVYCSTVGNSQDMEAT